MIEGMISCTLPFFSYAKLMFNGYMNLSIYQTLTVYLFINALTVSNPLFIH